jgi:hypothetical protein
MSDDCYLLFIYTIFWLDQTTNFTFTIRIIQLRLLSMKNKFL